MSFARLTGERFSEERFVETKRVRKILSEGQKDIVEVSVLQQTNFYMEIKFLC